MLALRWHAKKDIRLENLPEPAAPDGYVKIKIKYCGVCGTDIHEYAAGPVFIPEPGKPARTP